MPADKPGRGSDQFPLRLPEGMREKIKAAADASGRSMNAEIVHALELHFDPPVLKKVFSAPTAEAGEALRQAYIDGALYGLQKSLNQMLPQAQIAQEDDD